MGLGVATGLRVVILMAAVLALAGFAASEGAQTRVQEEEALDAACYSCHAAWSPVPMRSMYRVLPPETAGAATGAAFEYVVEAEQTWVARPPWPKLVHFDASLDLRDAPSLAFVGSRPPALGASWHGAVPPPDSPIDETFDWVVAHIPAGASDVVVTLSPNSTDPNLGPDLAMRVHPGKTAISPGATPALALDEWGRGQPERLVLRGGGNVSALSGGSSSWVIEARLVPDAPAGQEVLVQPQGAPFSVTVDAWFNTTAEPRRYIASDRVVEAGGRTAFAWGLVAAAPPGPGEQVLVTVNATAHYVHKDGVTDDYGNFTKSVTVPVRLESGRLVLALAAPAAALPPPPVISLTRIGEVVGYVASFLLVGSLVSGGAFGARSRRVVSSWFGSGRRRVAFHNAMSYFLTVTAVAHLVVFLVEANYEWTLGILWGGGALLAMALLGVTGALQVPIIRSWGYGRWRWTHLGLAIAAVTLTVVHMLLDGANFVAVQRAIGWNDPFPRPDGS